MIQIIFGGIEPVLENLKVKNIIIPKQVENSENYKSFVSIVKEKKINVLVVKQNDVVRIEKELYFEVLWPGKEIIKENAINNNALVCKLIYKNFSMLFTGDIEKEAESVLVNEHEEKLKAEVLKVGHHGSKTSSTQEFLEKVQPKSALIGVGKNNKFSHPNDEVIERIKSMKCKIYRTDENGEITIKTNGEMYKITKFINNK